MEARGGNINGKLQQEYNMTEGDEDEFDYDELIEKHHLDVVNNLDMNRQFIFSYLRSKNVIDEEDCEIVINTAKTRKQKVSIFLDIIKRKGDTGIKHFIDALEFEHPQLYRIFTGKEAAPVLVPPSQDLFSSTGLPTKEYIDLDRELLAEQLEQTVKILHQKARLINKLQDEKNVLEKKLFEANENTKSLQQYVESIKSELERSSEIKQLALNESNNDSLLHSMQALQQEVMTRMSMVIALQGKLLAQTEQMEAMKTEMFELKAKSNSWKQEVYELTIQCDNERRQSRRLNEEVIRKQSCGKDSQNKYRLENLQLKMEIGRLKEDNEILQEEISEFRKYGEVLNAKFSILSQEKTELQEENEDLSQMHKNYFDQIDEMEAKTKCVQRDYQCLKKNNERYLNDIKQYREIQRTLYADLEKFKSEIATLRKRNEEQEESLHKQYDMNMVLEEKYRAATDEIDHLREQMMKPNEELLHSNTNTFDSNNSNASNGTLRLKPFRQKFRSLEIEESESLENTLISRTRSNRELLDSIKKKVISPCQSPVDPPRMKAHSVPAVSSLPRVKGLLTYEQLGLLFPPDVRAAYMATYQSQNESENVKDSDNKETVHRKLGDQVVRSRSNTLDNEPILSANLSKTLISPFLFEDTDLFQDNEFFSSEDAMLNNANTTVYIEDTDTGNLTEKSFRQRTQQVSTEHLIANNKRRLSTPNVATVSRKMSSKP